MIDQHLKLFACLNEKGVEYLLIGGALSIAYGVPRVTKDIDIFVNPTKDNVQRCLEALTVFGMGTAEMTTVDDVCSTEVTIFKDFVRLDVLTKVKGLEFITAWKGRVWLELESIRIPSISLDDLIRAKQASGRPGDLEDVKVLKLARSEKNKF